MKEVLKDSELRIKELTVNNQIWFEEFLSNIKNGSSRIQYRSVILNYLEAKRDCDATEYGIEEMTEYLASRLDETSPKNYNKSVSYTKKFYEFLNEKGFPVRGYLEQLKHLLIPPSEIK
ncbi:hypothetical protein E8L90_26635 [Brevibacillus antibioticus]|uniref:Uncharacterized protein n=1 Tax=Brevibacillus antibioticus TaxID=2570228 RepID=A0A4U2YCV2_9BACL|nr:hypothetical protein [Brevibacillus antibioticus]TKI58686.1 hypothetical protein E8L90_26635 [Brevibacillus antibioticus]